MIIFEHFVFGVCKLIDFGVPDIPESLDIKVMIFSKCLPFQPKTDQKREVPGKAGSTRHGRGEASKGEGGKQIYGIMCCC